MRKCFGEVPSGFYLTDSLIELDRRMGGVLLVPPTNETKETVAATESKRLKKLLGSLRHLFRNSFLAQFFLSQLLRERQDSICLHLLYFENFNS